MAGVSAVSGFLSAVSFSASAVPSPATPALVMVGLTMAGISALSGWAAADMAGPASGGDAGDSGD